LASVEDARWARDQILDEGYGSDALVHYEEIQGGHGTFLIGKNMTYFSQVVRLVREYNGMSKGWKEREEFE